MNPKKDPNNPSYLFDDLPLDWLMTRWEKYAFTSLLSWVKPKIALEIGTFRGGSLQVLARHSKKVISVDLLDEPKRNLSRMFPNVDFRVGDSSTLVPELIHEIQAGNEPLEFVLIDGDHTTEGVCCDIQNVLAYRPKTRMYIVMHDSFHPPCREGMLKADWAACPYVHSVELDFVPGVYFDASFHIDRVGAMYGGFALARLESTHRLGDLCIGQVQKGLYEAVCADALKHQCASAKESSSIDVKGNALVGIKRALRPWMRIWKAKGS